MLETSQSKCKILHVNSQSFYFQLTDGMQILSHSYLIEAFTVDEVKQTYSNILSLQRGKFFNLFLLLLNKSYSYNYENNAILRN